jgi:hypothetical protein
LNLISVLQPLYPLCFFVLQPRHFSLNLHAFLILLVDSADQLRTLLLALHVLLHAPHLGRFIFLILDHLFHRLSLQLLSAFLYSDHFLVLGPLHLKTLSFSKVLLCLSHLLLADGILLLFALSCVPGHQFSFLLRLNLGQSLFFT